eukprot:3962675-Lingulodinium_polyedra.AAC.1
MQDKELAEGVLLEGCMNIWLPQVGRDTRRQLHTCLTVLAIAANDCMLPLQPPLDDQAHSNGRELLEERLKGVQRTVLASDSSRAQTAVFTAAEISL